MNLKVRFFVLVISIVFSNVAATQMFAGNLDGNDPNKVIKAAPPSPVFTDAERQTELAKRRKQVADMMADDSMLILFSADAKLYTNDVNYVYRQENNLYYLTALKQNGVMCVMTKNGGVSKEILFLPKRNPQFETWNGRMYSNDDATQLSGIKTIVDTRYTKDFLEAIKNKKAYTAEDESFSNSFIPKNLYVLQGNTKEFAAENEFADSVQGYSMRNALPIFAKLRLVKSPYEIKLMRQAVAITNEGIMRAMGMVGKADWEY
ncbi:MAG: aminopeptidase P N-terminal domain-containing protein, partial [Aridibacter sp.]